PRRSELRSPACSPKGPVRRRSLRRWLAQVRRARMTGDRKLTAILAADMAGYSRQMAADETGTVTRLKTYRLEVVDRAIGKYHGRIVKTAGDGMIAEFASVVGAVECAVEIQRRSARRDADMPPDKKIEFRIGINLGDVIVDGDDILGDGVNIAARLEGIAE